MTKGDVKNYTRGRLVGQYQTKLIALTVVVRRLRGVTYPVCRDPGHNLDTGLPLDL